MSRKDDAALYGIVYCIKCEQWKTTEEYGSMNGRGCLECERIYRRAYRAKYQAAVEVVEELIGENIMQRSTNQPKQVLTAHAKKHRLEHLREYDRNRGRSPEHRERRAKHMREYRIKQRAAYEFVQEFINPPDPFKPEKE